MNRGCNFQFLEEPIENGPGMFLGYRFMISQHNLTALKLSCRQSGLLVRLRDNRTYFKDLPLGLFDAVPAMNTVTEMRPVNKHARLLSNIFAI